jgi:hypothetical protein
LTPKIGCVAEKNLAEEAVVVDLKADYSTSS